MAIVTKTRNDFAKVEFVRDTERAKITSELSGLSLGATIRKMLLWLEFYCKSAPSTQGEWLLDQFKREADRLYVDYAVVSAIRKEAVELAIDRSDVYSAYRAAQRLMGNSK